MSAVAHTLVDKHDLHMLSPVVLPHVFIGLYVTHLFKSTRLNLICCLGIASVRLAANMFHGALQILQLVSIMLSHGFHVGFVLNSRSPQVESVSRLFISVCTFHVLTHCLRDPHSCLDTFLHTATNAYSLSHLVDFIMYD